MWCGGEVVVVVRCSRYSGNEVEVKKTNVIAVKDECGGGCDGGCGGGCGGGGKVMVVVVVVVVER